MLVQIAYFRFSLYFNIIFYIHFVELLDAHYKQLRCITQVFDSYCNHKISETNVVEQVEYDYYIILYYNALLRCEYFNERIINKICIQTIRHLPYVTIIIFMYIVFYIILKA